MNAKTFSTFLTISFFLTSCISPPPAESDAPTARPDLQRNEYRLIGAPPVESTTLHFADLPPEDRNARARGMEVWAFPVHCDQNINRDVRAWCVQKGEEVWLALPDYTPDVMAVILTRNGEEVYRVPIGQPSPTLDIMGLWLWDNHWALETVYTTGEENQVKMTGQISLDGVWLNAQQGYEEAFGFQLLAERPFFFFQHKGTIHAWYDGEVLELGYEEVPHYLCCSWAPQNPVAFKNMVSFFGRRGETWYYVEIVPAR